MKYKDITKGDIKQEFFNSREYETLVEPGLIEVFFEHDSWFVRVEDLYFDIEDPLSERTFTVEICTNRDNQDKLCFEEI